MKLRYYTARRIVAILVFRPAPNAVVKDIVVVTAIRVRELWRRGRRKPRRVSSSVRANFLFESRPTADTSASFFNR